MPDKNGQKRGGLRTPRGGIVKGQKWGKTLQKDAVRELFRQKVTEHLEPMIEAQVAAVIGVHHLMLRNEDGTWRKATDKDDIEAALNGDPNMFFLSMQASSTQAFNTLAAYAVDKPKEQDATLNVNVTQLGAALDAARLAAAKRNKKGT